MRDGGKTFEHFDREVMGFIDDDDRCRLERIDRGQKRAERRGQALTRCGGATGTNRWSDAAPNSTSMVCSRRSIDVTLLSTVATSMRRSALLERSSGTGVRFPAPHSSVRSTNPSRPRIAASNCSAAAACAALGTGTADRRQADASLSSADLGDGVGVQEQNGPRACRAALQRRRGVLLTSPRSRSERFARSLVRRRTTLWQGGLSTAPQLYP